MSRKFPQHLLACGVLGATLLAGCIVSDTGAADTEANRAQVFIAPRRISPLAEVNLPSAFLVLNWTAVPGALAYDVYFGVDPNPPLVATVTTPTYQLVDLPECTVQYWRVVARDETQLMSSPTWKLKTRCP